MPRLWIHQAVKGLFLPNCQKKDPPSPHIFWSTTSCYRHCERLNERSILRERRNRSLGIMTNHQFSSSFSLSLSSDYRSTENYECLRSHTEYFGGHCVDEIAKQLIEKERERERMKNKGILATYFSRRLDLERFEQDSKVFRDD